MDINTLSEQFSIYTQPFFIVLIGLIFTFWLKDLGATLAKGISFSMNRAFKEGDKVILDGESALIVKVGMMYTVFGITKANGVYCWRYVPNERIPFIKLEKVIFDKSQKKKDETQESEEDHENE